MNELLPRANMIQTPRFIVIPLSPKKVGEVMTVLLQDEHLAEILPWMEDKSADGARSEAFLLELQCARESTRVWGIVMRARAMFIGAVIVRNALTRMDVDVICASPFWDQGVADEVGPPFCEWLEGRTLFQNLALNPARHAKDSTRP